MSQPLELPDVHKTPLMRLVEHAHGGRDIRLVLIERYQALGSQRAVARALGVSQSTVDHWMAALRIGHAPRVRAWLDE
jgi:hypothetical protein